jgi:hypothetical protein
MPFAPFGNLLLDVAMFGPCILRGSVGLFYPDLLGNFLDARLPKP